MRLPIPMYAVSKSPISASSAAVPWNWMRPPVRSTYVRSAISIVRAAFCSTSRIVVPLACSSSRISKTRSTISGARPSVGSSSRSSFGFETSARAIASCCCSPPESLAPDVFQ